MALTEPQKSLLLEVASRLAARDYASLSYLQDVPFIEEREGPDGALLTVRAEAREEEASDRMLVIPVELWRGKDVHWIHVFVHPDGRRRIDSEVCSNASVATAMRRDLTATSVLSRIRRAFPTREGNREEYFPEESKDGVSEHWQVRRFLEPKDWDAISVEDLQMYQGDEQAILAFLTPKGFRYYLPAFLSISLQVIERSPALAGAVIFYLTPRDSDDKAKRDVERYADLTSAQREAVRAWLKYVNALKEQVESYSLRPDVALARYWDQP